MNPSKPDIRAEQCVVHPALRSLIRNIIIIKAAFAKNPVKMEGNFMPSPHQAMFINLYTRFKSRKAGENHFNLVTACTLIGAQVTPFKLLAEESHTAVSIIFQPGGLNRFLNIPMTELFDEGFSARDVIGKEIQELVDKSHDTLSSTQLHDIVQSYFLRKLSRIKDPLPFDFALRHLVANHNTS